jgi:hypothetical protein
LKIFKLLILLQLSFGGLTAIAQNDGCVDEFAKNPTFQCNAPFNPVCACDGNTYFNQCDAYNHGGIVFNGTNLNNGVCGDAAMFLGQDANDRLVRMFFQFKQGGGNLTFMVVDIYGKIMRQQFIRSVNELPITLDINTSTFPPGIYIAFAFGGNFRKTIKFSAGTL